MNINDFVILPGSKTGTSVRLKTKTVRELQLEKAQLETENKEMEKRLQQLQLNMRREKEQRKKSSAYHWKSGQAGPMITQARVLPQSKEKSNKVSSGKARLKILKEQIQEPVTEPFKHEMANSVAHEKSEVKKLACGLCEIQSALLTGADTRAGKLEVIDHFMREVNLRESKMNHEQKKVNSKYQVTSDKFSSLPPSADSAEATVQELCSESTCTGLENQDKGLLLNGAFNEEESAKSFQKALLQWRRGNRGHREQLHASDALSESVGICEVQTNLTVRKEPVQIEFKQDGLSYLEKLLLKKYRRTPVEQMTGSCIKDLRAVEPQNVPQAVTGEEGEGDDDIDDLTVEEVKRYWKSVFREDVPNTLSESADFKESSLKTELLDDSYGKDLEGLSNFVVMEAGAIGMSKQRKTDQLEQMKRSGSAAADQNSTVPDLMPRQTVGLMRKSFCHLTSTADTQWFLPFPLDRNPVSNKEISQEKMAVCSQLERNAVQKESVKLKKMTRSLISCKLPEKISNPTELMSSKYLLETLQKPQKGSQQLDSICNSHSLLLPVLTKSSVLQDVANRQKSVSTQYWGFEGFFVVGANPKPGVLGALSSLSAVSSHGESKVPFPGDGKWVTERSSGEYAADSVVQGVLEGQLKRPSSGLGMQKRISAPVVAQRSCPGNDSGRPWPRNNLHCKMTGNCPTNTQPRPKSSSMDMFRDDTEVVKYKCLDITTQDEWLWEDIADQEALLTLEKELQSYTGPEKHYSLPTEDATSSSKCSEKIFGDTTVFHKNLELNDQSRVDTIRGWDESQMDDEEEILEDKQQVLALQ